MNINECAYLWYDIKFWMLQINLREPSTVMIASFGA